MTNTAMYRFSDRLNKPEYWFQPRQLLRKALFEMGRYAASNSACVKLPWGVDITVNPHDSIGKSLATCAVYELAVSEVLWRVTDAGESCIDAGANIGYMTSLLAVAAGPNGRVFSFEPHPLVYSRLEKNRQSWIAAPKASQHAPISLYPCALGANDCELDLAEPEQFARNQSAAKLLDPEDPASPNLVRHQVQVRRLDGILGQAGKFGVMKIDVEGAEWLVLQGATGLLAAKNIRDVVLEDFRPFPSESINLLKQYGYAIFRIAKSVCGPALWDPTAPLTADPTLPWEPVNYLATIDPKRALTRLRARGWQCLQRSR